MRSEVAAGEFSPDSIYELLSEDKDAVVRTALAGNPAAPVKAMRLLAQIYGCLSKWNIGTFHRAGAKGARLASSISGVSTGRIAGASVEHPVFRMLQLPRLQRHN